MIVVHGIYNFRPRVVAFRRDYCRSCRGERLAVRVRSFDVLHLFWVPLLPLGYWRRWFCVTCKSRPHRAPGTRPFFKWAAVPLLALVSAAMWAPMPDAEPGFLWVVRIGTALLTLVALRWALTHRPEPDAHAALAAVTPYAGWQCPVCGEGEFLNARGWRCRVCHVVHEPLAQ